MRSLLCALVVAVVATSLPAFDVASAYAAALESGSAAYMRLGESEPSTTVQKSKNKNKNYDVGVTIE
jgi:hypothetical protein